MIIKSPEEMPNDQYKKAVLDLLYQLADDDFILAYRGSEWLGLAPHIEEDVAYSSINQDTMGHATMYYQLLEELGEGSADSLAHARTPSERRNAILLEEVNGPGDYLTEPRYDWAFAVVRHYFYSVAKKVRIDSLKNSSYEPLAQLAIKINTELYYHLLHWKTWFLQLVNAGGEAPVRMKEAMDRVLDEFQGVLSLGPSGKEMEAMGLIEGEENLKKRWELALKPVFQASNLSFPPKIDMKKGDGRKGEHTADLNQALSTLSEVYNTDPAATW
ncbi:phenylacetate-CoA oxygenase subunit PaaC [Rossellomorea aquimaris]|uniref:1,2-phenylacetyl-CoA epoxidase subunit PaaC n=1 Tax=Rossellomorea aquimaris TaxID=189382 RepID=UPI001CD61030|nr:1,2-phenylacetyl-CoA epoxidase subunit PaaC [Rossellomorea aquimaris]MCA1056074.1 phenylacetate-CoA oxygenase subunit PaaC [Rossellomorea aquimaris]